MLDEALAALLVDDDDEALLLLVGGGVEVGVDVPGGGEHHLAGAHGAQLDIGQRVVIVWVPERVELDQLLDNSLGRIIQMSIRRGNASNSLYLFSKIVHFDTVTP